MSFLSLTSLLIDKDDQALPATTVGEIHGETHTALPG
jgi:hypothetical protein